MLGDKLTAELAEQWGLIWRCVDDEALESEAKSLAEHLAVQPTRGFALAKKALACGTSREVRSLVPRD